MKQPFGYARFRAFHNDNPDVFRLLEKYTQEAYALGKEKLGLWLLVGRARWDSEVVTTGSEYKLPNGAIGYYSRLLMHRHPEWVGLFDVRPMLDPPPWWTNEDPRNPTTTLEHS